VQRYDPSRADDPVSQPGDALVRAGALLFGVGALATIVTVLPMFLGASPLPTLFYAASMVTPVGLGLALLGLWRQARARRG